MTSKDRKILQRARRMKDYQNIDNLIELVDSEKAKEQLRMMSQYRYHSEEDKSGVGI